MSLSTLPLSYCTNVHPGRNVSDVILGLDDFTLPVRENFGERISAGLWLAEPVIREILTPANGLRRFAGELHSRDLTCHTLNAFPYGDFHSERVKENVYLPDWSDSRRLKYTVDCATVLAGLLAEGTEGSISTVPLGFKGFKQPDGFEETAISNLLALAKHLQQIQEESGRIVRLAIEPEPCCLLETTDELIAFFERLRNRADDDGLRETADRFLGVCFDVCHQSIEFEDVADSIARIDRAGIRLNKIHITVALQIDNPANDAEARKALSQYAEQRYLHQTTAQSATGEVHRFLDLTEEFTQNPPEEFLAADCWRIHFHVPVNAEQLGPLKTTRPDLRRALAAVAALDDAPHLEVETYTWDVLPDGPRTNLVKGLTEEMLATRAMLSEL